MIASDELESLGSKC